MLKYLVIILTFCALVGCDTSTPDFYYTQNDLKYQYHDIVEDGRVPIVGDYLTVYLQYKSTDDEVLYDSKLSTYDGKNVIILGKPQIEGGIEEGFAQLMEGDSVTFFISPEKFYQHYLHQDVPKLVAGDEEMKVTLRLLKVESSEEYQLRNEVALEEAYLNELETINDVVADWKTHGKKIREYYGVYMVFWPVEVFDTIKYGDNIAVKSKGYYPDGRVFYDNTEDTPDEYKVGVSGQTLEGVKLTLLKMSYGQKARVLIPSDFGFNKQLVEDRVVPPYQPLIFDLEVMPRE